MKSSVVMSQEESQYDKISKHAPTNRPTSAMLGNLKATFFFNKSSHVRHKNSRNMSNLHIVTASTELIHCMAKPLSCGIFGIMHTLGCINAYVKGL